MNKCSEDDAFSNTVRLAYDVYETPRNASHTETPLILLHGLYFCRKLYSNVAENLCRSTGRKVYNLDLRSHGDSPYPDDISVEVMAEDVKLFMREYELEKVIFVCHSFSCRIATVIAIQQPNSVEKIVFIDYSPYWTDEKLVFMENFYYEMGKKFLVSTPPGLSLDEARRYFQPIIERTIPPDSKSLVHLLFSLITKSDKGMKFLADAEGIHKAFNSGMLGLETCGIYEGNVLLLLGWSPTSMFRREAGEKHLKYFPNTKVVKFEDANHLFIFQKTERFISEVKKFLQLEPLAAEQEREDGLCT